VPTALGRLLGDPDPHKSKRVVASLMQMKELDVDALTRRCVDVQRPARSHRSADDDATAPRFPYEARRPARAGLE
jgi:hypothetical protein